jgi:hypothetical protein
VERIKLAVFFGPRAIVSNSCISFSSDELHVLQHFAAHFGHKKSLFFDFLQLMLPLTKS